MILLFGGSEQSDPTRSVQLVVEVLARWGVSPDKLYGVWLPQEAAIPASWKHHHAAAAQIMFWAKRERVPTALFEAHWLHHMRDAPAHRSRFMLHAALGAVASTQVIPHRVGVVVQHAPSGARNHALLTEARNQTTWGDRLLVEEVK